MATLRKVLPLFLLLPLLLFPQGNQNNVQLGLIDASASAWKFPTRLFANLPAAASSTGQRFSVTDCLTNTCAAGSGTVRQDMVSIGGAWVPAVAYVTSVGFTGGLISVATASTTPAFTVAGTSGGIPYFSGATTWASSGALTQYFAILGGGAGNSPTVSTIKDDGTAVTITQNAVVPFASVAAGAVANTLYLSGGSVGIGTVSTSELLNLFKTNSSGVGPTIEMNTDNAYDSRLYLANNMGGLQINSYGGSGFVGRLFEVANYTGGSALYVKGNGYGAGGLVGIGGTNPAYGLDVAIGVGLSGTARFFDQTATTGATLVTITPGASQTSASTILSIGGITSTVGLTFNGHACSLVVNVMTCP